MLTAKFMLFPRLKKKVFHRNNYEKTTAKIIYENYNSCSSTVLLVLAPDTSPVHYKLWQSRGSAAAADCVSVLVPGF